MTPNHGVIFCRAVQPGDRFKGWKCICCKGLAAQSKAEAIGQNKISSANQRPGFQMIFFSFWSGLIYCYELCVYGSKVMIVVEYSVHEQHMNPFICPFPLEKD